MNEYGAPATGELSRPQRRQFSRMLDSLQRCCADNHASLAERCDIPQAELRCLLLFGREPSLTAKGIAERLGIARSRVTKLVSGLTEKDLLTRMPDPADSRVALLALTPAGEDLRREAAALRRAVRDAILDAIAPEFRRAVLQSLDMLNTAMARTGETFFK